MANFHDDDSNRIYIKKNLADQIFTKKRSTAARWWRQLKQFLLLILLLSTIGSTVLILFFVNMPNGHLTYLGYTAMLPLALVFATLGFRFLKLSLLNKYDSGKTGYVLILGLSVVFSYAIVGHGFVLYTYFHGIPHQSEPLKIMSKVHRTAHRHIGNSGVSITGDYYYFQQGHVYPHNALKRFGSNHQSDILGSFIDPRLYRDGFVTEDNGWLIDPNKTAVIYYKVSPFAVVGTAIQGYPYFSNHLGKKHPLILFGIDDFICYPFTFCVS